MPLAGCNICDVGVRTSHACPYCRAGRRLNIHLRCCGGHRCERCNITLNAEGDLGGAHATCTRCAACCNCFQGRCFTDDAPTNRVCVVCRNCSTHCPCRDTIAVNTLRRTASAVRFEYARRRAQEARALQADIPTGERVAFIAAGQGAGKEITIPVLLSTAAVHHIYGEAAKRGESVVLPYQFKENTSKRFICPEIEVAYGKQDAARKAASLWGGACNHDGSLSLGGFEVNLSPTQGDLYPRMIEEVCHALVSEGATIDKKCGLHVHVDARDLDYMDVRKVVLLYELVEPALFACLPTDRHTSRYTVPCGSLYGKHLREKKVLTLDRVTEDKKKKQVKQDLKAPVIEMVYGKGVRQPIQGTSKYGTGQANQVRYRAMNLYSYYYRKSIEFRHSPGSIDPNYITEWSLICAGIIDTAKTMSEKKISGLWPAANKVLTSGSSLYDGVFTGKLPMTYLAASVDILMDCCQPRSRSTIEVLLDKYKGSVTKMRIAGGGGDQAVVRANERAQAILETIDTAALRPPRA